MNGRVEHKEHKDLGARIIFSHGLHGSSQINKVELISSCIGERDVFRGLGKVF